MFVPHWSHICPTTIPHSPSLSHVCPMFVSCLSHVCPISIPHLPLLVPYLSHTCPILVFFIGLSSQSKIASGGPGGGAGGTSNEISSMTSGSFDKSSADGAATRGGPKKVEKSSGATGKRVQPKMADITSKGLPMISEKSGTPSEVSTT